VIRSARPTEIIPRILGLLVLGFMGVAVSAGAMETWEELFLYSLQWQSPVDATNEMLDRIEDAGSKIDSLDLLALIEESHAGARPSVLAADILNESGRWPAVAAFPGGDYVISYERSDDPRYQEYDEEGAEDGDEVTIIDGNSDRPDVAVDEDHNVWVVFEWSGLIYLFHEDDQEHIYRISNVVSVSQENSAIAVNGDGYAACVWESKLTDTQVQLRFARFSDSSDQVKVEDDVLDVSDNYNSDQQDPDIAVNSDDEFLVVWTKDDNDIKANLFERGKLEPKDDFKVALSSAEGDRGKPRVAALRDDYFFVVWEDERSRPEREAEIWGRLVTGKEEFVNASDFRVDDSPVAARRPAVTALEDRDQFLVVWADGRAGDHRIYGLLVDTTGKVIGASFFIAQAGAELKRIDVTAGKDDARPGEFILAWEENDELRAGLYRLP